MPTSQNIKILKPIFLIGFMGTGKSTVGLLLGAKLERRFVDLDAVIEEEAHMTIVEIFFNEREAGFRAREAAALRRVAAQGPQLIAVGGGAPAHGDNMDFMLHAGKVVCLSADVAELVRRIGDPANRPMLGGAKAGEKLGPSGEAGGAERSGTIDVKNEIEKLLPLRQRFYERAHLTIDTTGVVPSQVAKRIAEELEKS